MSFLLALALAQTMNLNNQPLLCMDEGAYCRADRLRAFELNCSGAGITCAQTGGRMTDTVSGGGGGSPTVSCGVGEALSWNGTTWLCVSTISTASALAADPAACSAGQFVSDISASGALTCSTPAGTYTLPDATSLVTGGVRLTGDLGGTATSPSVVDDSHAHTGTTISALDTGDITTGTLSGARGGLGATQPTCSAGTFLTCNGTSCSCSTPSGASPLTTKGDIYTYSMTNHRLPTSTDGLCLKTNSATGTGLEWGTCAAAGGGLSFAEVAAANLAGAF